MTEHRPSDIFLALVKDAADAQAMTFERFQILIDTWSQIRELEAMATAKKCAEKCAEKCEKSTRVPAEKVHADDVEKVHEDPPDEGVQNGPPEAPARDPSEIGKQSFATRKRNVLARIEDFRAAGGTMQEIADAAPGLTISSVMDAIARKSLPLTVWTQLEKAMKKIEARLPDGPMPGD